MVFRSKQLLDETFLKTINFSYILSFLNYANIGWVSTHFTKLKNISYKQKQAARIVFDKDRLCHSRPLLWRLNMLNVYQIFLFQNLNFINRLSIDDLPKNFTNTFNKPDHKYPPKFSICNYSLKKHSSKSSKFSVSYRGPKLWNEFLSNEQLNKCSKWTIILAFCLAVIRNGCTCLSDLWIREAHLLKRYFQFICVSLSVCVFVFVVFMLLYQIKGKKAISKNFVSPLCRNVVGLTDLLKQIDSDYCRFCLGKQGPFSIDMKWMVNHFNYNFYLYLLNTRDFYAIISNNFRIIYFSWRWNEINKWMNNLFPRYIDLRDYWATSALNIGNSVNCSWLELLMIQSKSLKI